MNIIDIQAKGNVLRFYLGENGTQTGDDWNDVPYEHNAGKVYDEFIQDTYDIVLPFEFEVQEACSNFLNSPYCYNNFKEKNVAKYYIYNKNKHEKDSILYAPLFGENIDYVISTIGRLKIMARLVIIMQLFPKAGLKELDQLLTKLSKNNDSDKLNSIALYYALIDVYKKEIKEGDSMCDFITRKFGKDIAEQVARLCGI